MRGRSCRKGKLIFLYELVIKLKWKGGGPRRRRRRGRAQPGAGKTTDGAAVDGTIEIPNLSEEEDIEDIEVRVALKSAESPAARKVKELVRKRGGELIRAQLAKWTDQLKQEYAADLIKPVATIDVAGGGGVTAKKTPAAAAAPAAKADAAKAKSAPAGKAAPKKAGKYVTISVADEFKCRPEELFRAICDEGQVRAYTQAEAKVDAKVGGEFSLFGGNVVGVFQELEPHKKIRQAWRFKHWPDGHFSNVTMTLTDAGGKTKLSLTQTEVPEADKGTTEQGWRTHQWDRMKAILGFGAGLSFGF